MHTKLVFLYGQWVLVTVLPPQPAPERTITVFPRAREDVRDALKLDVTIWATRRRRGKQT